jgi:hypothetical protein
MTAAKIDALTLAVTLRGARAMEDSDGRSGSVPT